MIFLKRLIYCCLLLSLVSCNSVEKNTKKAIVSSDSLSIKTTSDRKIKIVARVNNQEITFDQLEYAINRFLPKNISSESKNKLSKKVLDSLIDSRLISILEEKSLDDSDRQTLNIKVRAYREELLVKKYIIEKVTPIPINQEEVYQYYLDHLEKFGQKTEKTYEIIQSEENITEEEKSKLLKVMARLTKVDDWSNWFENNNKLSILYYKRTALVELLEKPIKELLESTKDGKTSTVLNSKKLTIVRVETSKKIAAKPFEQVSKKIRRMLAPQSLKRSISKHILKIKKEAKIEIFPIKSVNNTAAGVKE